MSDQERNKLIPLLLDLPVWDRVFSVAPLVIVGSKEANGEFNLAPKHLAMPLGLGNYFCFVCTPQHYTYHNIRRHGLFTVSYPRLGEAVFTSLAAAPRAEDQTKPALLVLPTMPASTLDGVLVQGCYLYLECRLHRVIDDFAGFSLIAGKIVDEEAPPYPGGATYSLEELTTEGYAALLRIERGRVRNREIFVPLRLHYGLFMVQARKSRYLIARENGAIAGALGFILDPAEKVVRLFELISRHDDVLRYLLSELERLCRLEWQVCYVEIDVSAYSPRMQRTLVELGFLPAAYIPALVFHEVERLDAIKMVRLLAPLDVDLTQLTPRAGAIAETVLRLFKSRSVVPRIAQAARELPLFAGLEAEQLQRLAGVCTVAKFETGAVIFREGEASDRLYVVLEGKVEIALERTGRAVGFVGGGESLGELSLLTHTPHSATARALTAVETAVLDRRDIEELIRLRPDIGVQIYKNLALGLGEKLKRADLLSIRS